MNIMNNKVKCVPLFVRRHCTIAIKSLDIIDSSGCGNILNVG